ncbi:MAG: hypothetical protein DSY42_06960 [Aquifex sp.]|nr:MAG: hypothetical protein DSY42_06960 [Aquifex sp.]
MEGEKLLREYQVELVRKEISSKFKNLNRMLRVEEVAEYLGVEKRTVRKWCRIGMIEAVKLGKEWRIPVNSLINFLVERMS